MSTKKYYTESYEKYYQEFSGTNVNESATNFSSEVEFLSREFQNVQNVITNWSGEGAQAMSSAALQSVLDKFNTAKKNIDTALLPATEAVEELKKDLETLKLQEETLIDTQEQLKNERAKSIPERIPDGKDKDGKTKYRTNPEYAAWQQRIRDLEEQELKLIEELEKLKKRCDENIEKIALLETNIEDFSNYLVITRAVFDMDTPTSELSFDDRVKVLEQYLMNYQIVINNMSMLYNEKYGNGLSLSNGDFENVYMLMDAFELFERAGVSEKEFQELTRKDGNVLLKLDSLMQVMTYCEQNDAIEKISAYINGASWEESVAELYEQDFLNKYNEKAFLKKMKKEYGIENPKEYLKQNKDTILGSWTNLTNSYTECKNMHDVIMVMHNEANDMQKALDLLPYEIHADDPLYQEKYAGMQIDKLPGVDKLFNEHLTQDEKNLYQYLLDTQGKDKANEYLDIMQDAVNMREGMENAREYVERIGSDGFQAWDVAASGAEGFKDGVVNFFDGIKDWAKITETEVGEKSALDYELMFKAQYMLEVADTLDVDLDPNIRKLLNQAYQTGSTVGTMAVPMIVGAVPLPGCRTLSSALMFASFGGNSAVEGRQEGLGVGAACLYGALNGGSELLMEKTLGAVPFIGDLGNSKGLVGLIEGTASEMLEEGLQSGVIENVLGATFFGEELNAGEMLKEGLQAAGQAAISQPFMQGFGSVAGRIGHATGVGAAAIYGKVTTGQMMTIDSVNLKFSDYMTGKAETSIMEGIASIESDAQLSLHDKVMINSGINQATPEEVSRIVDKFDPSQLAELRDSGILGKKAQEKIELAEKVSLITKQTEGSLEVSSLTKDDLEATVTRDGRSLSTVIADTKASMVTDETRQTLKEISPQQDKIIQHKIEQNIKTAQRSAMIEEYVKKPIINTVNNIKTATSNGISHMMGNSQQGTTSEVVPTVTANLISEDSDLRPTPQKNVMEYSRIQDHSKQTVEVVDSSPIETVIVDNGLSNGQTEHIQQQVEIDPQVQISIQHTGEQSNTQVQQEFESRKEQTQILAAGGIAAAGLISTTNGLISNTIASAAIQQDIASNPKYEPSSTTTIKNGQTETLHESTKTSIQPSQTIIKAQGVRDVTYSVPRAGTFMDGTTITSQSNNGVKVMTSHSTELSHDVTRTVTTTDFFGQNGMLEYGSYGVSQNVFYRMAKYEDSNGRKYSYYEIRDIIKNAQDNHLPIPRFKKVCSPKYYEIKDYIMKNYGLSTTDASIILTCLNDVGACTYASVCNSIFDSFKNDPMGFEQVFGFPMYKTLDNKNVLNLELLLVDIYIYANTISNGGNFLIRNLDGSYRLNKNMLTSRVDHLGRQMLRTTKQNNIIHLENGPSKVLISYLNSKKLSNKVNRIFMFGQKASNSKMSNLINRVKNGMNNGLVYDLIITTAGRPITILSPVDSKYKNVSTQTWNEGTGHAMHITDVTTEGFVVSSWGMKYTVPFADLIDNPSWVLDEYKISKSKESFMSQSKQKIQNLMNFVSLKRRNSHYTGINTDFQIGNTQNIEAKAPAEQLILDSIDTKQIFAKSPKESIKNLIKNVIEARKNGKTYELSLEEKTLYLMARDGEFAEIFDVNSILETQISEGVYTLTELRTAIESSLDNIRFTKEEIELILQNQNKNVFLYNKIKEEFLTSYELLTVDEILELAKSGKLKSELLTIEDYKRIFSGNLEEMYELIKKEEELSFSPVLLTEQEKVKLKIAKLLYTENIIKNSPENLFRILSENFIQSQQKGEKYELSLYEKALYLMARDGFFESSDIVESLVTKYGEDAVRNAFTTINNIRFTKEEVEFIIKYKSKNDILLQEIKDNNQYYESLTSYKSLTGDEIIEIIEKGFINSEFLTIDDLNKINSATEQKIIDYLVSSHHSLLLEIIEQNPNIADYIPKNQIKQFLTDIDNPQIKIEFCYKFLTENKVLINDVIEIISKIDNKEIFKNTEFLNALIDNTNSILKGKINMPAKIKLIYEYYQSRIVKEILTSSEISIEVKEKFIENYEQIDLSKIENFIAKITSKENSNLLDFIKLEFKNSKKISERNIILQYILENPNSKILLINDETISIQEKGKIYCEIIQNINNIEALRYLYNILFPYDNILLEIPPSEIKDELIKLFYDIAKNVNQSDNLRFNKRATIAMIKHFSQVPDIDNYVYEGKVVDKGNNGFVSRNEYLNSFLANYFSQNLMKKLDGIEKIKKEHPLTTVTYKGKNIPVYTYNGENFAFFVHSVNRKFGVCQNPSLWKSLGKENNVETLSMSYITESNPISFHHELLEPTERTVLIGFEPNIHKNQIIRIKGCDSALPPEFSKKRGGADKEIIEGIRTLHEMHNYGNWYGDDHNEIGIIRFLPNGDVRMPSYVITSVDPNNQTANEYTFEWALEYNIPVVYVNRKMYAQKIYEEFLHKYSYRNFEEIYSQIDTIRENGILKELISYAEVYLKWEEEDTLFGKLCNQIVALKN